jgi:hypothetical protein
MTLKTLYSSGVPGRPRGWYWYLHLEWGPACNLIGPFKTEALAIENAQKQKGLNFDDYPHTAWERLMAEDE